MKKFLIYAITAFATLFASCSQDQESPVNLNPDKSDLALSLKGNVSGMIITKGNIDLPALTQVGVYALDNTTVDVTSTSYKNALYSSTGSGGVFTSSSPLYLNHTGTYKALAYAPYQSSVSDEKSVSFSHGTDVLYAPAANVSIVGSPTWNASVSLLFVHKMSQIKFTLSSGSGSPDLTGATLNVSGFNASCTMNLNNGTITPVTGTGAIISDLNKAVCFVPNSNNMTLNISVKTNDGRTYQSSLTATFISGSSYSCNIVLNKNESQLSVTGSVVDWVSTSMDDIQING